MPRTAAALALAAILLAGCASDRPAPADDAASEPSAPVEEDGAPWRVDRVFSFTVTHGFAVPGAGTSGTSYDGLEMDCAIFDLPEGVLRLSLWLNSTGPAPAVPVVGGVTFDLREEAPDTLTGVQRHDPDPNGPHAWVLVLEKPQPGHYLVNYKAEGATVLAKAEGHFRIEGERGEPQVGQLAGCGEAGA